jgi:hypothetical protein
MIKTIISIVVSFAVIFGLSAYEIYFVNQRFDEFYAIVKSLHQKTEQKTATYEDGVAVQTYWREQKHVLHVWLPHTLLQETDYHLDEVVGLLYTGQYESALPKLEVVLGLAEEIPRSYELHLGNVF